MNILVQLILFIYCMFVLPLAFVLALLFHLFILFFIRLKNNILYFLFSFVYVFPFSQWVVNFNNSVNGISVAMSLARIYVFLVVFISYFVIYLKFHFFFYF